MHCYRTLCDSPIELIIAVDSKDLYSALRVQGLSTDKLMPGDIKVIRYELETFAVLTLIWISGKLTLAEIGTNFDIP